MSVVPGLRERKKAATRAALSAAANRLVMEHGLEHVTIEAIAAEADVSPRTFHNYFSSREEAVVASVVDWADATTDALQARPADEPIWDALRNVLLDSLEDSPMAHARMSQRIDMILHHPTVLASQLAAFDGMRRRVAAVIAARTGTDAETDLYPNLLAGAAAQIIKTATDMWAAGPSEIALADLVSDAFELMRAGLPEPVSGSASDESGCRLSRRSRSGTPPE